MGFTRPKALLPAESRRLQDAFPALALKSHGGFLRASVRFGGTRQASFQQSAVIFGIFVAAYSAAIDPGSKPKTRNP